MVIQGAMVSLPHGEAVVDLGIGGGAFHAIAAAGVLTAAKVVDASGLRALPGGVDPHVHVDTRFGEWATRDDFRTASVPAAFGGTTTFAEFAIPRGDESAADAVARRRREAEGAAVVDYALHAVVTPGSFEESLRQLEGLAAEGVGSVKVFSTYRSTVGLTLGQIHTVLRECARTGQLVLVHCETDSLIEQGIATEVAAGRLGPRAHATSRTTLAEADAIRSIGDLAADAGARVYFVHVSSAAGAAAVSEQRRLGRSVLAETCTQYLFLDDSVYDRPGGELWICSPPIRPRRDQEELWHRLDDGTLDVVSTDHNCFDGVQKRAHREDFRRVPNGLPGIECRMPLMASAATLGRLTWARLVELTAAAPARALGLWPRKGAIAVGSDADLVLVDERGRTELDRTHMATDYSAYQELTVPGRITQTWVRGRCLVKDGEDLATPGWGRFLSTTGSGPRALLAGSRA